MSKATNETDRSEAERADALEYQQASEWWRQISQMRRHDLAFFTALQGSIVTVIGARLAYMDARSLVRSLMAFCVAAIWFSNGRRSYSYLCGSRDRAVEIEKKRGMTLIMTRRREVKNTGFLAPSWMGFSIYCALVTIGWVAIWPNICR